MVNLYISYTPGSQLNLGTDFTLGNKLFRSVKLTKNDDLDKYNIPSRPKDLILVQNFYLQMEAMEKMLLFLELI